MKALTAVVALALISLTSADAQDTKEPSEAELKAFQESIAPGKEHAVLKKMAGRWTTEQKIWGMAGSDAEPIKIKGTARGRLVLGGRYLMREYECDFPGVGPYKGMSTSAYDKTAGEYIDTWIDTMGTGVFVSRGKSTGENTIEQSGSMIDPMTKSEVSLRTVTKIIDRESHTFTMWQTPKGEKETKVMEITYQRVKAKARDPKPKKGAKAENAAASN